MAWANGKVVACVNVWGDVRVGDTRVEMLGCATAVWQAVQSVVQRMRAKDIHAAQRSVSVRVLPTGQMTFKKQCRISYKVLRAGGCELNGSEAKTITGKPGARSMPALATTCTS